MFSSQSTLPTLSSNSIDWATLAQQWIQNQTQNKMQIPMREEALPGSNVLFMQQAAAAQQQQKQHEHQFGSLHTPEVPPPPPGMSDVVGNYALPTTMFMNNYTMPSLGTTPPMTTFVSANKPAIAHNRQQPNSLYQLHQLTAFEEKGEADMDMDDDIDGTPDSAVSGGLPFKISNTDGNEIEEQPPPAPSMHLSSVSINAPVDVMQRNSINWTHSKHRDDSINSVLSMEASERALSWPGTISSGQTVSNKQLSNPSSVSHQTGKTAHIPSLLKLNVANPHSQRTKFLDVLPSGSGSNSGSIMSTNNNTNTSNQTIVSNLDAAKRKMLPAWIREGLEKMEREKQRQLERAQQEQIEGDAKPPWHNDDEDDDGIDAKTKLTVKRKTAMGLINDVHDDDDDDESDNAGEDAEHSKNDGTSKMTKLKMHDMERSKGNKSDDDDDENHHKQDEAGGDIGEGREADDDIAIGSSETTLLKSYEQNVADLMIAVRRTLTELLLEVTNDEIAVLSNETIRSLNSNKIKASSAQVIRKSALSSITGKLGLAAYANSSGSSDDEDDDHNDNNNNDDDNNSSVIFDGAPATIISDEELKANIRMKKRAWAKISTEIEETLADITERESQKLKFYSEKERQSRRKKESTNNDNILGEVGGSSSRGNAPPVGKSFARNFGETTTTTTESKLLHSNGKQRHRGHDRQVRKERTTRFSDNKDSGSSMVNSIAYLTQIQEQRNLVKNSNTTVPPTVPPFPISVPSSTSSTKNDLLTTTGRPSALELANILNAADEALEKAGGSSSSTKKKHHSTSTRSTQSEERRHERRRERNRNSKERQNKRDRENRHRSSHHRKNEKMREKHDSHHRNKSRRERDRDRNRSSMAVEKQRPKKSRTTAHASHGESETTSSTNSSSSSTSSSSSSSRTSYSSSAISRSASQSRTSGSSELSNRASKVYDKNKEKSIRSRSRSGSRKRHHDRNRRHYYQDKADRDRNYDERKSKSDGSQRKEEKYHHRSDSFVKQRHHDHHDSEEKSKKHRSQDVETTKSSSSRFHPSRSRSHSRSSYASSSRRRKR